MNVNKALIVGRATADPELRSTPSGQQVTSFGVATNRVWYDQNRQKQEQVEFHNIVVWGKQAELASKFITKGQLVFIEGRLQTRGWQGKDGQQRKTTEIVAERIQFGPRAGGSSPGGSGASGKPQEQSSSDEIPVIDVDEENVNPDDLPF